MIEVSIKGLEELERKLRYLPHSIQGRVDEKLGVGTGMVAEQARDFAPFLTGYLRSTIGFERRDLLDWIVYAGAYYAPFVEGGTSKMAARPFMRPALVLCEPAILSLVHEGIAQALEERGGVKWLRKA